jgi:hypothetical protein
MYTKTIVRRDAMVEAMVVMGMHMPHLLQDIRNLLLPMVLHPHPMESQHQVMVPHHQVTVVVLQRLQLQVMLNQVQDMEVVAPVMTPHLAMEATKIYFLLIFRH